MKDYIQKRLNFLFQFQTSIYLYLIIFWIFNGLDKFLLPSTELGVPRGSGLFFKIGEVVTPLIKMVTRGFGKDRVPQFKQYFDKIGWSEEWIEPLLTFAGVFELALGLVFICVLYKRFFNLKSWLANAFAWNGSMLVFISLSALDVATGDRTELWEHGTYILMIIASYMCITILDNLKSKKEHQPIS